MRGAIAFNVLIERLAPSHHLVKLLEHIVDHIGIGVLVDRDTGGRMGCIDDNCPILSASGTDHSLNGVGYLDHLASALGLDIERFHRFIIARLRPPPHQAHRFLI